MCQKRPSFLNLNHILFYVYINILFIHSFADGHLGCFFLLTTVHNAAKNVSVQYLFESLLSVLLCIYPKVGLLDHIVILLKILGNHHTVLHSGRIILRSSLVHEGSNFSHLPP